MVGVAGVQVAVKRITITGNVNEKRLIGSHIIYYVYCVTACCLVRNKKNTRASIVRDSTREKKIVYYS